MAEAEEIPDKFQTEVSLLMMKETETVGKMFPAKQVKYVKIQPKDENKPLVTKPVWPYELWQTNFEDSDSEFRRQTRFSVPFSGTSKNQPLKMPKQDDGESVVEAENSDKESNSLQPKGTSTPEQDLITEFLQRSATCANMLSELQNLLSVGVDKFFQTDSTVVKAECDSLENSNAVLNDVQADHEDRISETLVDENCQLPRTYGDKNTFLGSDMNMNSNFDLIKRSEYTSMEDLSSTNQNEVCKEEGMKNVNKDLNEKSISKSEECFLASREECRDQTESRRHGTKLSSKGELVHNQFDYKESTMENTRMESADTTLEASERRIETSDCKQSQILVENTEQDIVDKDEDERSLMSKICHFKTELKSPVSLQSLLYNSVNKWLPNISIDQSAQTKFIQELASSLMNTTVVELQEKHQIFSKCYIIETGSMTEGTKICQPDELDFSVALPMLANPDVAELFYIQMGIKAHLHDHFCSEIISFLQQFPFFDGSYRHYLTNGYLLQVFRETMKDHIPEGWVMREESDLHMMRVFLKNQTLTVHLQCTDCGPYPGFILSIDVCFGIPLDAERLHSIYVADLHHALNISFIHNECLRMRTGVIAVISQNPLVAERFFYETEPYRFDGNKPVKDCYKLAKHVARTFLPKIVKNKCILCEDTLIPSFYIKTVVSFMRDFYTESRYWSDAELVNRLIEIFEILRYSFVQGKFRTLAYYSYIHSMYLDCKSRYIPKTGSIKVGVGMDAEKPCTIPSIEHVNFASSPVGITTPMQSYWKFMECEEWTVGELLGKLTELLYFIKFTETSCSLPT